jgi:hypothetical protein
MNQTLPHVRIGGYLVGIPDDALERLRVLIDEKFVPRAPRFAAMLLDVIDDEAIRRCRTRVGPPREPSMPTIEPERWSDAEVAEALVTSNVARSAVSDPAARTFMERVNACIVALAAHRLERSDLTKGGST